MGSTFFKVNAIGLPDVKSHVRRSNAQCLAESSEINVADSPLGVGNLDHAAIASESPVLLELRDGSRSRNRELPPTILAGRCVGRTVQADRTNSRIDR